MSTVLAVTSGTTTTTNVELIAVVVFYGLLGYALAVWTRRSIGTTPWRLPAIAWALVSAMLPFLGLVVELLARFTTRHVGSTGGRGQGTAPPVGSHVDGRSGGPTPWGAWPPPGAATGPNGTQHGPWPSPVRQNPAGGQVPWPEQPVGRPGPGGWRPTPPGAVATTPPPLFGWYPDPDSKHEQRYWDGRVWSDLVRDGDGTATDPLSAWQSTEAAAPTPWSAAPAVEPPELGDRQGGPPPWRQPGD